MSNVRKIADILENSLEKVQTDTATDELIVNTFIKQLSAYEEKVRKEIFESKIGGAK
jgi:hypothetical protein